MITLIGLMCNIHRLVQIAVCCSRTSPVLDRIVSINSYYLLLNNIPFKLKSNYIFPHPNYLRNKSHFCEVTKEWVKTINMATYFNHVI